MSKMEREQINSKILILGVDGMDPRATEYFLTQGKMPNVQKLLDRGAANEHLEMLGRSSHGHAAHVDDLGHRLLCQCARHHLFP